MTVGELAEQLKQFNPDKPIFIRHITVSPNHPPQPEFLQTFHEFDFTIEYGQGIIAVGDWVSYQKGRNQPAQEHFKHNTEREARDKLNLGDWMECFFHKPIKPEIRQRIDEAKGLEAKARPHFCACPECGCQYNSPPEPPLSDAFKAQITDYLAEVIKAGSLQAPPITIEDIED